MLSKMYSAPLIGYNDVGGLEKVDISAQPYSRCFPPPSLQSHNGKSPIPPCLHILVYVHCTAVLRSALPGIL